MLLEFIVLFLILGFVWNYHTISELKLQVFDLNQEILQMKLEKDKQIIFGIEESEN
jgi:hypothetical protein